LYLFLPTALLVWIVELVADRPITRYFADVHLQGGFFALIIYLTVLSASIVVVAGGVRLFTWANKGPSIKVKSIRLTDNTKGMGNYEGLYLVIKSEKIYLFVDKFGEEATFYILNEVRSKNWYSIDLSNSAALMGLSRTIKLVCQLSHDESVECLQPTDADAISKIQWIGARWVSSALQAASARL
jgi:hypothetical protein